MKNFVRCLSLGLCMLTLASACFADALSEGRDLYKAGKFSEAAAKLELATKEAPTDAKAWWQLNFAYNKLEKYSDALSAAKKAAELDPAFGFTSGKAKYDETIERLQGKLGGATSAAPKTGSTTAGSGGGSIVNQLMSGDVYVEAGMNVDVQALKSAAVAAKPTVVKFVVFNSNANSRQLEREASRIRKYLKDYINQGKGYVIASSRKGVVVSTESLNEREIKQLVSQIAPQMEAGRYSEALVALSKGLVQEKAPKNESRVATSAGGGPVAVPTVTHGPNWLLIILVVGAAIFGIVMIARAVGNAKRIAAMREPLERLKSDVLSQMNYLDDALSIVPAATASRVREARVSAGTRLDEASKLIARGKSINDFNRAQSLLDQAQGELRRARGLVDTAMAGGTATASVGGGKTPPVYAGAKTSDANTNWDSIPDSEKGICFFTGRPCLLSELTPVTVKLDGSQQKVLASPEALAQIKSGSVPQIRAFNNGGQYVPWYAAQDYDPYHDYYARGYNRSDFLMDMITISAINSMYWNWHHPVGWGWGGGYGYGGNTYIFYGDHPGYHDYYSSHSAGYGDYSRGSDPSDAGGTDFLGSTGGDLGGSIGGDAS